MHPDSWRGRSVLVTGHTGFKGSWLALWLLRAGARVSGFSLPSTGAPTHWDMLRLDAADLRGDIRNAEHVAQVLAQVKPEIVFHLAAQALVRRSYAAPLETWSTNVSGTANVLEACRKTSSMRAMVVVTTDKVYANQEWLWGYRENDRLGGHDPYSASKAACELVVESYRKAFFNCDTSPLLASARAGNVIGGGDWSEDRLIPDLVRAVGHAAPLEIRSPNATRPWQHVLDCLNGYLLLGEALLNGNRDCAGPWNFGPDPKDNLTVTAVLQRLKAYWPDLNWQCTSQPQPHEANLLYLDNTKSKSALHWRPVWDLEQSLDATAAWYRHHHTSGGCLSHDQFDAYLLDAQKANEL